VIPVSEKKINGLNNMATFTTDHDEIRAWIEEHGGEPALRTRTNGQEVMAVRFNDLDGETKPIEWDEFFDRLDSGNLAFFFADEEDKSGKTGEEEFEYRFLTRDQIPPETDNQKEGMEMPNGTPLENVVPDAPAQPSPDAPNDDMSYTE